MTLLERIMAFNGAVYHGEIKNGKDFYKIEFETSNGIETIMITERQFFYLKDHLKLDFEEEWGEDILRVYILSI